MLIFIENTTVKHILLYSSIPRLFYALAVLLSTAESRSEEGGHEPVRGIYINAHAAGSTRGDELVDALVAAGGNAIVFDVKDRLGRLSYTSEVALARSIGASKEATIGQPLERVGAWRARGLYVIARLTCFHDARLAEQRGDLAPLSRSGAGVWSEKGTPNWVDPSRPEVQQYLIDLALEVAAFGVDEIQLDYVRFPTEGNLADAVFAFDPKALPKADVITGFVRRMRAALDPIGVRLSADIFGVTAWGSRADTETIGQHVDDLLAHLDVVSPMLYPSHFEDGFGRISSPVNYPYYFLYQGCERLRQRAAARGVEVRPWIQAFDYRVARYNAMYVTEQLYGAEDGGAQGWLLWNPRSRYEIGLEAIAQFVEGTALQQSSSERQPPPIRSPSAD